MELKPCPFCGSEDLARSVDGGILPSYIEIEKQVEIRDKTPYVISCEVVCCSCGARVEGYAASANSDENLYHAAIHDCYVKWNRRTD